MDTSSEDYVKTMSHSKMTSFKVEHVWKIDHFSDKIAPKTESVKSSMFSAPGHDIQFQLKLCPISDREEYEKFIALYLWCFPGKSVTGEIPVTYELTLLKSYGNVYKQEDFSFTFNITEVGYGNPAFEEYSIIMDPKNNYLHDNHQLNICCKATVFYNRTQIQLSDHTSSTIDNAKFTSSLKFLLDSGKHSDFNIVISDTKIPVHKNILSARSPVFEAMFNHRDTMEAFNKEVVIDDVLLDVMKDFLLFIYTGLEPQNDRLSVKLLVVADKYQVDDLKSYCEEHLSLKIENVIDVFLKADLHNAAKLKAKCLTFIAANFYQVSLTEDWELMCKSNGEKMIEVSRALREVLSSKNISLN